jgi:hypothetical protein
VPWRQWGPYLSERQWGTVREDYSEDGNAWDYFTHDQARSRAYHWGEDGIAGISDDKQRLCFALGLWNGKDPILKERIYGLTNSEANHGEDVKEYYFYLDSTPTHSYMKYLYKYPQAEYPYLNLIETNRHRGRLDPEYELLDTGIFNEDRYFDVLVEYAKASPSDILIQISVSEQALRGKTDLDFLKRVLGKLAANFGWWVNRKDRNGRNLFEGGFLGLDNIGVFDRSAPLPTGGYLEQADGTAWVALYAQNMVEIVVELAAHEPAYEELATNFGMQFLLIARAMNAVGPDGMWDEEDGFYYDVLRLPDGSASRLKVRSMVGLLPLCATTVVERWQRERVPTVTARTYERFRRMPELRESIHATGPGQFGVAERGILALVNESRLRRILSRMLDENEFLSPYGIRALSRHHAEHPYVFSVQGQEYRVNYLPAESDTGMFGGNSNWRGPIWMPVNVLLIRALLQYFLYYGDSFKIECPTGSGNSMNLFEVAREIANRLTRIFLRDAAGRRPVFGGAEKFQCDPYWRDHLLFYEYFHGDNGAGIGASHQTGWTGLVAPLIEIFGHLDARTFLQGGREAAFLRE